MSDKMLTEMCPLDFATKKSFSDLGESRFRDVDQKPERGKLSDWKGTVLKSKNSVFMVLTVERLAVGCSIRENSEEREAVLGDWGTARWKW